ncbi:MAG: M23 family metallopeptidase [Caulobacterales bacterium]|jgi:murein DD-endopeptidase MepM/ murein hydrolase activator NlpD|nr:M23 family metallopeptidase [Caulobacterales bacterium]
MLRLLAISLAATTALAGCAVSNTSYPRTAPIYLPPTSTTPQSPSTYASVPRAVLHSELFACGNWGANIGEIGARGEAVGYTPYIYTPAGALLRNPTERACLSSGFGWRGAAEGGGRLHNGLDLANREGGYIYAAGDGWIDFAAYRGGYGLVVEIEHEHGVRTLYAHLAEIDPSLEKGDMVAAGQPIGRMGMTGNATGVHLHYEVTVDDLLVDPLNYGTEPSPVL